MVMKIFTGKTLMGLISCFLLGLTSVGATVAGAMDMLKTGEVQIRATAPGMTATGGYLTIHNHDDEADRLVAIAADFAAQDKRVRHVRNESNLGAAPNYDKGLELARGDFLKWCAHDD